MRLRALTSNVDVLEKVEQVLHADLAFHLSMKEEIHTGFTTVAAAGSGS